MSAGEFLPRIRVLFCLILSLAFIAMGCGGGITPPIQQGPTEEQAQEFWQNGQSASEQYLEQIEVVEPAQARINLVDWLKTAPGVVDAGISPDSTTVWFDMESGITGYLVTFLQDSVRAAISGSGLQRQEVGVRSRSLPPSGTGKESLPFESPNPGNALLMNAWDNEPDNFAVDKSILLAMGYQATPEEVRITPSSDVTRETFRGIAQYSVIHFYGHGSLTKSGAPMLLLREECLNWMAIAGDDFSYSDTPVYWDIAMGIKTQAYWAVTADYIKKVGGIFRRSVVILDACYSLRDDSFFQAFGSTCLVLGWRNLVSFEAADEASEAAYEEFCEGGRGLDAKEVWAQYLDLGVPDSIARKLGIASRPPERGRPLGSDSIRLTADLTGSWLGEMIPKMTGDPRWGLVINRYGKEGMEGNFVMETLENGVWQNRGMKFTADAVNPNGEIRENVSWSVTSDDKLAMGSNWIGERLCRCTDYDTIRPYLKPSFSPEDGSTVPPNFEVSLPWSEPMGNWWSYSAAISGQNTVNVYDWRYDPATYTTRFRVSVTLASPPEPATMMLTIGRYYDIWGNSCDSSQAVIVLTIQP